MNIAIAAALAAAVLSPAALAQEAAGPRYAPLAMADLLDRMCSAAEKDGANLAALAKTAGLGDPQAPPAELQRGLPDGAVTWKSPTVDGALYLFGYGEAPLKCGVVVAWPLPGAAFQLALEQFQSPQRGFVVDSTQMLGGNVHWTRLKSPAGQYVDLMEYPAAAGVAGVLRADLLAN